MGSGWVPVGFVVDFSWIIDGLLLGFWQVLCVFLVGLKCPKGPTHKAKVKFVIILLAPKIDTYYVFMMPKEKPKQSDQASVSLFWF